MEKSLRFVVRYANYRNYYNKWHVHAAVIKRDVWRSSKTLNAAVVH